MLNENGKKTVPCAMSVAGSDSGGGAGIQADLLTFAAHGIHGCTAITALTAQNPDIVKAAEATDVGILYAQMETACAYYKPNAAKTGMLFAAEIVECVADFFARRPHIALVVDPVMISTSGARLLKADAVAALTEKLMPSAALITPNLDEGAALMGKSEIADISAAAAELSRKFGVSVLLKGGHLRGDEITDVLAERSGKISEIKSKRVHGVNTHGSGCTLSASITANLAKGMDLPDACRTAQAYIVSCMKNPLETSGGSFINHFPML